MRVLMLGRADLLTNGGGDKVQVENTAEELRLLGIEVDIKTDSAHVDFSLYDLVHVFQLDWVPETFFHVKRAKEANKPVVLSPIHHSIKEVQKFEEKFAFDFRRLSKLISKNQHTRDTLKNIYRAFFDPSRFPVVFYSVIKGLKTMHSQMLTLSDVVLVQTEAEACDLEETFGVKFKWVKVQNGVGHVFLDQPNCENDAGMQDYIICVGRVEARKNQLSVIKAVELLRKETGKELKLVIVGAKSSQKHFEYIFRFNRELKKHNWIIYKGAIPYEKIPAYLKFAKVCVSASWFETSGLTSLEALFMGTNVVASGARAKEILGNLVSYCEPDNIESIKQAISKEYFAQRPVLSDNMRSQFTWKECAKATLKVYKEITGKK